MELRAQYLLQIIEKIGSPLLRAVGSAPASMDGVQAGGASDPAADAQKIAELLSNAVQLSIELGKASGLDNVPPQDGEGVRLGLTALASALAAEHYKAQGRVPAEADFKRITGAIETVMTFSQNFEPSADNAQRLAAARATGALSDALQVNVQMMQAFMPVVTAVGAFPFGQQEKKLIQDVGGRLLNKAQQLREAFFPDVQNEDDQKRAELGILDALAQIYASCHNAEMNRMMRADGQGGELSGLDKVWADFDLRADMLESLSAALGGAVNNTPAAAPDALPVAPAQAPQPQEQAAPVAPPPAAVEPPPAQSPLSPPPSAPAADPPQTSPLSPPAPTASTAQPNDDNGGGGSPMGFFSKNPAESTGAPAAPAAEPVPVNPPSQEAPPPPPPAPPPTAPVPPPAQEQAPAAQTSGAGSPMGFFTKQPGADATATSQPSAEPQPEAPVEPQAPAAPPPQESAPPQSPVSPPPSVPEQQSEDGDGNGGSGDAGGSPMSFFKKGDT